MTKLGKVLFILSLATIAASYFSIKLMIPAIIRSQVTNRIEDGCETCKFNAESIELHLFPTRLVLAGIHFETGNQKNTFIQVDVNHLTAQFSFRQLTHHLIKVQKVMVEKPVVLVIEGDGALKKDRTETNLSPWDIEIKKISLNNAAFIYQKNHLGRSGALHIGNINGEIGELGSSHPLRDQKVKAHITAELENSGAIDLTLDAMLFNKYPDINVDVELHLDHMDMSKTQPYFTNNSGIDITGYITTSQADVAVRGNSIHSKVNANYRNLQIDFHKTFERNALATIASNLFSGIKSNKSRSRAAALSRDLEEPLVGWIVRGIEEAALKVATDK